MIKKQKMCGVYKITSPNNRVYIGSSSDIEARFSFYKTGAAKTQWVLKRSFIKYGIENHKFEVLEICEPEIRLKRERHYGDILMSLSDFGGLNLVLPSYDDIPALYSIETLNKMSEVAKNRTFSEETRKKFSNARKDKYKNGMHPMSKILLNINTGVYYDCLKEAAYSLGLKRSTLSMKMTGRNRNNTPLIYV
jgi:group I intron endonuclease